MKKKHAIVLVVLMVCLLTLAGSAFLIVSLVNAKEDAREGEKVVNVEMFSSRTEVDAFQTVPVMNGENVKIGEVKDYGEKNYIVDVNGSTVDEYKAYLNTLTEAGFKKHSDNGEDAMEGYGLSAAFTKDNLTVVVSHVIKQDKTYISAAFDLALSDHMIYDESYMDGVSAGAKTKVHMLQLHANGSSFVIQLKNGHFVVHDGGQQKDAPYFLDYLEDLTPGDEKPVIEAWFISHAHGDHYGAMQAISTNQQWIDRISVNGIYFHIPPSELYPLSYDADPQMAVYLTSRFYNLFKDENGNKTKFYRPQFGQKYYFCDITIDVCMTPEQFTTEAYYMTGSSIDMNDTSIWLMHHIEGQRMLIGGDAFHTGVRAMMTMYEESYFELDVFVVLHHGINVYDYFTDYMNIKTALYPSFRVGSVWEPSRADLARVEDNAYFQTKVTECYSHGEGSVTLTFPYEVGTAEIAEPSDWRYDHGIQERGTWEG